MSQSSPELTPSRFPQTIVAVSRQELIEPVKLTIRDSAGNTAILPNDLPGHFLVIRPSGSPDSLVTGSARVVWVSKDGWTPLYNGDGLVYRVSFEKGNASLKTRFVKPPCYYVDRAITDKSKT
ncbi:MAG TPA: hypothetical protein V6C71_11745 [Coleofasciculaceae cyanobacterium]|jgi:hypothetical protein